MSIPGVKLKKNNNGFIVAQVHYTADPAKDAAWKAKERPGYTEAGWRREMEIDFEALSGTLVYSEYNPDVHHISRAVLDKKRLNNRGSLYRILDHGKKNPTAVLWVWIDEEDNWIIYREYYVANEDVEFHSHNIKKLSGRENYAVSLADPSIFAKNQQDVKGNTYSIASIYEELGLEWEPANNSFQSGNDLVHQKLRFDPERIHPFTGKKGSPALFFVREECTSTDWEMRKWRYQEFSSIKLELTKNVKESPVDKDNHLMDCLIYFANNIPEPHAPEDKPQTAIQKDIEQALNKQKNEEDRLWTEFDTDF